MGIRSAISQQKVIHPFSVFPLTENLLFSMHSQGEGALVQGQPISDQPETRTGQQMLRTEEHLEKDKDQN